MVDNVKVHIRTFPGGKGGRCIRLTTYHHPVPLSRNLGTFTSWNPLGLSRPVMGLLLYIRTTIFVITNYQKCMHNMYRIIIIIIIIVIIIIIIIILYDDTTVQCGPSPP